MGDFDSTINKGRLNTEFNRIRQSCPVRSREATVGPARSDDAVLEFDSERGALRGLICSQTDRVENLQSHGARGHEVPQIGTAPCHSRADGET